MMVAKVAKIRDMAFPVRWGRRKIECALPRRVQD